MEKTCIHIFGKRLRREFRVPDDLPFPMRKALEALAFQELAEAGQDIFQPKQADSAEPMSLKREG